MKGCWICQGPSLCLMKWSCVFCLSGFFVRFWWIAFIDLHILRHPCISELNHACQHYRVGRTMENRVNIWGKIRSHKIANFIQHIRHYTHWELRMIPHGRPHPPLPGMYRGWMGSWWVAWEDGMERKQRAWYVKQLFLNFKKC